LTLLRKKKVQESTRKMKQNEEGERVKVKTKEIDEKMVLSISTQKRR